MKKFQFVLEKIRLSRLGKMGANTFQNAENIKLLFRKSVLLHNGVFSLIIKIQRLRAEGKTACLQGKAGDSFQILEQNAFCKAFFREKLAPNQAHTRHRRGEKCFSDRIVGKLFGKGRVDQFPTGKSIIKITADNIGFFFKRGFVKTGEKVCCDPVITVHKGEKFAPRPRDPEISRIGKTAVLLGKKGELFGKLLFIFRQKRGALIGRTIVDTENFKIRKILFE